MFFNSSQVEGHEPEPAECIYMGFSKCAWDTTKVERFPWHLLKRILPPIHPFVLELAAVEAIALAPPRFPLLLLPKPGGGPRADLLAIGALHNSD